MEQTQSPRRVSRPKVIYFYFWGMSELREIFFLRDIWIPGNVFSFFLYEVVGSNLRSEIISILFGIKSHRKHSNIVLSAVILQMGGWILKNVQFIKPSFGIIFKWIVPAFPMSKTTNIWTIMIDYKLNSFW